MAERPAFPHQVHADGDHAEQARFCQHAGQQGAGRGRGHRMGLGQPDMQWRHARLGAVADQHKARGKIQPGIASPFPQNGKGQAARFLPAKKHAHQRDHAAGDGHAQIRSRRPHGALGFLVGHPGIGGDGHDFKEHKGGVEIIGQEHAHHAAFCEQRKQGIAAPVGPVTRKILQGKLARHGPHKAGQQRIQRPEGVYAEGKAQAHHLGGCQSNFLPLPYADEQPGRQGALRQREQAEQQLPRFSVFQPRQGRQHRARHGEQQHDPQNHEIPPPARPVKYAMILPANTPASISSAHSASSETPMQGSGSVILFSPGS